MLLFVVASCRDPAPTEPLQVELAGCREWRSGPLCEVGEGDQLSLFVRTGTISAFLDGQRLRLEDTRRVQGGISLHLSVRPGSLTVRAPDLADWTLALGPHRANEELRQIAQLRRNGERVAAEKKLEELGAIEGAAAQRGRNALAAGRIEEAIRELEAAVEEDRRLGKHLSEMRDRLALAHTFLNHRYPEATARAQLEALAPLAAEYAEAAADVDYTGAVLASEYNDVRSALLHARRLMERAERLARDDLLDAREILTNVLVFAGRWAEVSAELGSLRAAITDDLPSCKAAELWSNIGWYRLLGRRQAPKLFPEPPIEALERAADLYRRTCDRPLLLANAEINLAWAALFDSDGPRAKAAWSRARAAVSTPDLRTMIHLLHLEAELLLAEKQPKVALETFDRLRVLAHTAGATEIVWRAHLGRGRALSAAGATDQAISAYRESEHLLQELAARVPLGEGRDALLFDRGEGARRLVETLITAGRLEDAVRAIRESRLAAIAWARGWALERTQDADTRARMQKLRETRASLDEAAREEWTHPADEAAERRLARENKIREAHGALDLVLSTGRLPTQQPLPTAELPAEEVAVYVHPAETRIVALVRSGSELSVDRVAVTGNLPVLETRSAILEAAPRVHFYVHPSLESLDWPKMTRGEAIFHADLHLPRAADSQDVLIAADPARALPRARQEAKELAERLRTGGLTVTYLEEADRAALFEALGRPLELFHYSGHGVQEGFDGLEAGFPLRDRQRFTVVDVLAARSAPRRVVLAACDLGQRSGAAGLSMAQAFLLAGADEVVAAVRPVDDEKTSAWVRAFYAESSTAATSAAKLARDNREAAFRVWVAN